MKTAYQREWEARRELDAAHRELEHAVGLMLSKADSGCLLTRATGVVLDVSAALVRCRVAREMMKDAERDPAPPPQPELHVFAPNDLGHCQVCGKGWAGGHPPIKAPAIVEGGSL